jgi:hypothetical protein
MMKLLRGESLRRELDIRLLTNSWIEPTMIHTPIAIGPELPCLNCHTSGPILRRMRTAVQMMYGSCVGIAIQLSRRV